MFLYCCNKTQKSSVLGTQSFFLAVVTEMFFCKNAPQVFVLKRTQQRVD